MAHALALVEILAHTVAQHHWIKPTNNSNHLTNGREGPTKE